MEGAGREKHGTFNIIYRAQPSNVLGGVWHHNEKSARVENLLELKPRKVDIENFENFDINCFMEVCNCSYSQAVIAWETYFIQGILSPACFIGNWIEGWDRRTIEDFMVRPV
jgi:hypothetical protein